MSSIDANAAGSSLSQMLQRLGSNVASTALARPTAAAGSQGGPSAADPDHDGDAGVHHRTGAEFKKIEAAVTTAVQSAQNNGSTDANTLVQSAIARVFQQTGIAPPLQGPPRQRNSGNDPDHDGDVHGAPGGPDKTKSDSAHQMFMDTLKAHGIDPRQFYNDLVAAVKKAQNGDADGTNLFQSIPTGAAVDANA